VLENLVGKLVYESDEDGFRTGEVKTVIGDSFLIQFDTLSGNGGSPLRLISFEELKYATWKSDSTMPSYGFFDTREELNRYIAWLQEPGEKPRVVELAPHRSER